MKRLSVTTVAGSVSGLAKSFDVEQRWAEGNGKIFKSDRLLLSTEKCGLQHWPSPDLDSQAGANKVTCRKQKGHLKHSNFDFSAGTFCPYYKDSLQGNPRRLTF